MCVIEEFFSFVSSDPHTALSDNQHSRSQDFERNFNRPLKNADKNALEVISWVPLGQKF